MASVSSKYTAKYRIRSNSLPSRTHPTTSRVEEELQKIKSWEESTSSSSTTAGEICFGLSSLQELQQSIDDLLNLPLTIEALCPQLKEKWVDELLDKSVKILDVCGDAKDLVSQCIENVRDLQSSLRRRKGLDSVIETSIHRYFSCRRKMKKDAKRSLVSLKQIDQQINASTPVMDDLDDHVSSIIRALQQANSASISIFQSVLKFLSSESYKQKTNKWDLVARFVQKERAGRENQEMQSLNEIENADAALCRLCQNDETEIGGVQIAQNRLQNLEGSLEGLENQLEVIFRCLIRSRTTLLNVFTC